MSLASLLGARIFDTMRGILGNLLEQFPDLSNSQAAARLIDRTLQNIGGVSPEDRAILTGWARDVVRSARAVERLNELGGRPIRSAIPQVPWIQSNNGQDIRYMVRVDYVDPNTGESVSVPVIVWSDTALTGVQVMNRARDLAAQFAFAPQYRSRLAEQPDAQIVNVRVIDVGRS